MPGLHYQRSSSSSLASTSGRGAALPSVRAGLRSRASGLRQARAAARTEQVTVVAQSSQAKSGSPAPSGAGSTWANSSQLSSVASMQSGDEWCVMFDVAAMWPNEPFSEGGQEAKAMHGLAWSTEASRVRPASHGCRFFTESGQKNWVRPYSCSLPRLVET